MTHATSRQSGLIKWLLSPWDRLVHAFLENKIGEVVAEAMCEHSAWTSRLSGDEGRKCVACLLLHGGDLAGPQGEANRWGL